MFKSVDYLGSNTLSDPVTQNSLEGPARVRKSYKGLIGITESNWNSLEVNMAHRG